MNHVHAAQPKVLIICYKGGFVLTMQIIVNYCFFFGFFFYMIGMFIEEEPNVSKCSNL